MKLPTDTNVFQNAWVVDDVEAAAMDWVNTFNIGPFFIAEYGPEVLVDTTYRGKPCEMNMMVGIAQSGPIQIELIQPLGEHPSAYRDTVEPGQTKFHHVCVWTSDIDADLAYYTEKGCQIASTGKLIDGPRFAYADTHEKINCMIELLEHNDTVKEIFKMIADAGKDWDGKDPIRGYE